jgi:hypothetical protein
MEMIIPTMVLPLMTADVFFEEPSTEPRHFSSGDPSDSFRPTTAKPPTVEQPRFLPDPAGAK